jgi:hypothetical protein
MPTKLIIDLVKLYNDNNDKYGGELYDILNVKLQIFYEYYNTIGLPEDQFCKAFPIMLKGHARSFYHSRITGRQYDFIIMVAMVKGHFKTKENRQFYWSEWREIILLRIIKSNPSKSKLECLQILFDKLQIIQRAISEDH